jgi:hypothetical protein
VQKCKSAAAVSAPIAKKVSEKRRRARGLSNSGTQTSMQELALAKPIKTSKKFVVQSSGLSIVEKAFPVGAKIAGKRTSFGSAGGSDAARASGRVLDLFDLGSSASGQSCHSSAAPELP